MQDDVAKIAAKLTKAQQEIIMNAPLNGDWFPVCWEGWALCSLQRRGLTYPREAGLQTLSPLGIAVRQHLQEKGNG